jgi:hypothetical protein
MTEQEAIAMYESKFWENLTHKQRAQFQINEERLCMPFDIFHEAMEKTLGRPVWTHEFSLNQAGLQAELNGECGPPTIDEIVGMLPPEKVVIIKAQTPQSGVAPKKPKR